MNITDIRDHDHYEVINPRTKRKEVWTGERIKAYQVINRVDVSFPKPKRERKSTKKVTNE